MLAICYGRKGTEHGDLNIAVLGMGSHFCILVGLVKACLYFQGPFESARLVDLSQSKVSGRLPPKALQTESM